MRRLISGFASLQSIVPFVFRYFLVGGRQYFSSPVSKRGLNKDVRIAKACVFFFNIQSFNSFSFFEKFDCTYSMFYRPQGRSILCIFYTLNPTNILKETSYRFRNIYIYIYIYMIIYAYVCVVGLLISNDT